MNRYEGLIAMATTKDNKIKKKLMTSIGNGILGQ